MDNHLLHAGQIFAARYRIERFLAEGGMGAVFVGEHTATEQRVAVKVLWPHVLTSKDAVEKFQLEAKVAGRVSSEHIVRVIDAGYDDETRMPFLVMELLAGKTLDALVTEEGPLAPAALLTLMRQVASGLDRAHGYVDKDGVRKPIVHRDLKPENLFLARRDTGEPLVKILDFGIAKVVSEGAKVSQEIKGTPLFMAYEQAGGGRITPGTDVWALGLIVFWLLSGRYYWRSVQPDADAGITQLFGEIISMPLESPTARLAEYGVAAPWSPGFDEWFLRCVCRDPAGRFASAGEAVEFLARCLPLDAASLANPYTGGAPMPMMTTGAAARSTPAFGAPATSPSFVSPGTFSGAAAMSHTQGGAPPARSSSGKVVGIAIAAVFGLATFAGAGTLVVSRLRAPDASAPAAASPPPARSAASETAATPPPGASIAPPAPPPATSVAVAPPDAPPVSTAGAKTPKKGSDARPPPPPRKTADPYGER